MNRIFKVIISVISICVLAIVIFQNIKTNNKQEPIKIGAILPITGSMAKYGKSSQHALEMALEEINKDSKKIQLIIEDSALEPKQALSSINKLISINKVKGVIGPLASAETLAVASTAEKNKILLISSGSSAPSISQSGDYIFRTVPSDVLEGSYMAKYIFKSLKKNKISIYYIKNSFGEGLKNEFIKAFNELGGNIVSVESFSLNQQDHRSSLLKINTERHDGIYIIGYSEMISIFEQLLQLNIKNSFFSTTLLNDQGLIDKIPQKAINGTIFASWDFSSTSKDKQMRIFIEKFNKKYGYMPDVFSANSYDALKIMSLALSKDNPKKYIYNLKKYTGASGLISFDENGDVSKPMVIKIIKNGNIYER